MAARTTVGTFGATAKRMARGGASATDAFPTYLDVPELPTGEPNMKMLNKAANKKSERSDPCGSMFNALLECVNNDSFKPGDCFAEHTAYFNCVAEAKVSKQNESNSKSAFKYHVERIFKELSPPMRNKRQKPKSRRTRRFKG